MPRLSKIGAAALGAFGWTSGSSISASYLQVAGGGPGGGTTAAGNNSGAGGGAGGYLTGTTSLNPTLSYTVTVGAGGAGTISQGSNGSNSSFGILTASVGGGAGGSNSSSATFINGLTGGSGGGGSSHLSGGTAGAGTSGQGFAGGAGSVTPPNYGAGGGGGASAVGVAGTSTTGGNGGAGTASSITGSSVTYAGGGGGATYAGGTGGTGGTGGGGAGASNTGNGTPGTANLGGGGGGACLSGTANQLGGNGGSGVVIISYLGAQQFGGGVVTSSGGYTIHTFNTSGTLAPLSSLTANFLVVAGGAGGAGTGAGGGAGGYRTSAGTSGGGASAESTLTIDTNSTYLVTVGAGGAGGAITSDAGTNGTNSLFLSITSIGGGGGSGSLGGTAKIGNTGGSGGGSSYSAANGGVAGAGTANQGFAGGLGGDGVSVYTSGGGGGGAAQVGATTNNTTGAAGGNGVASSITGASVTRAGGGGGGTNSSGALGGSGGSGGGGKGSDQSPTNATAGEANTGGGGGGAQGNTNGTAKAGGSGIVVIAYAGSTQQMAGGTVTISGGNVIHTFTSSGYLTPLKLVNNSLRFRSSASAYLNRTPTVSSNRTTWTWSGWVKIGIVGTAQALFVGGQDTNNYTNIYFTGTTAGNLELFTATGGTNSGYYYTSSVFRDPAAWYHIVVAVDTTASTKVTIYVNGIAQPLTISTAMSSSYNTWINSANVHRIGSNQGGGTYFDGYMTEINFIDGQALTPNSFGTFNSYGVWQPITYGGSYGTNGFYLPFTNKTSTTTLGYDFSPAGNNWTTNNISLTTGSTYDSMTDVPTLTSATVANYAVLNPLSTLGGASTTNGNLNGTTNTTNGAVIYSTIQIPDTGKWYWELTPTSGGNEGFIGIESQVFSTASSATYKVIYYANNGNKYVDATSSAYGATWTDNDVIAVAVNADSGTVTFYKNNTSQGAITYSVATKNMFVSFRDGSGASSMVFNVNFGQQPFTYTPPTGFLALNTYNL